MRPLRSVDIFCRVIDNFGDIGVCWRLARQLANEWRLEVRLWVDDLVSFRQLCPTLELQADQQRQEGINIIRWQEPLPLLVPHDLVIEAFACDLPPAFVAAMAGRTPVPYWINLEYLTAEAWADSCHGMASPHPRWPLIKHFFFPGFRATTGGLLCEHGLPLARREFQADAKRRAEWLKQLHVGELKAGEICVSLFAYENRAISSLLDNMAASARPVRCLMPVSRVAASVQRWLGVNMPLAPGMHFRHGNLSLDVLPFLSQPMYDQLLWFCDINFVRGEDSLARALWAARPCIWHIYPQDDAAHWSKLEALFELYTAGLAPVPRNVLHRLWQAWNHQQDFAEEWDEVCANLPELQAGAELFASRLTSLGDLAGNLLQFCKKIS